MTIRMKDGREFTFKDVSKTEYDNFLAAPSKGRFLNAIMKGRRAGGINWYVKATSVR
jgi:hypothetical protein